MLRFLLNTVLGPAEPRRPDPLMAVAGILHRRFSRFHGSRRTSLQHLLYLVQVTSIGLTGKTLFDDAFQATAMGPRVARIASDLGRARPLCADPFHLRALSDDQIALVEQVCDQFADASTVRLVATTSHPDGAWAAHFGCYEDRRRARWGVDRGSPIPTAAMAREWTLRAA